MTEQSPENMMAENTPRDSEDQRIASRKADALKLRNRRVMLADAAEDEYQRTRHSVMVELVNPRTGRIEPTELGFVKPTIQTERKLRPNPITRMVASKSLTEAQGRAAIEIGEIYEAVTSSLLARASKYERVDGGRQDTVSRSDTRHATRYLPWAEYLGGAFEQKPLITASGVIAGRPATQGRCPIALVLTIDIVVDGKSISECEAERRWFDKRSGTEMISYSLGLYAQMAGWEDHHKLIEAFEQKWRKRATAA